MCYFFPLPQAWSACPIDSITSSPAFSANVVLLNLAHFFHLISRRQSRRASSSAIRLASDVVVGSAQFPRLGWITNGLFR